MPSDRKASMILPVAAAVLWLGGCAQQAAQEVADLTDAGEDRVQTAVGEQVTVEGTARLDKEGDYIQGRRFSAWVDYVEPTPPVGESKYPGPGITIRVTGILRAEGYGFLKYRIVDARWELLTDFDARP